MLVLKITFFHGGWFGQFKKTMRGNADEWVKKLHSVTRDSPPDSDLKNLWNTVQAWERILRFLQDEILVSKWALLLGTILFGCIYVYFALLFSFAYYGIARVAAISAISWLDFFVMSLFMPFFVSALPRNAAIYLIAGIQCTLILTVGIGGIFNYFRRRVRSISIVAKVINVQLSDEAIREKKSILSEKFSSATGNPGSTNPKP